MLISYAHFNAAACLSSVVVVVGGYFTTSARRVNRQEVVGNSIEAGRFQWRDGGKASKVKHCGRVINFAEKIINYRETREREKFSLNKNSRKVLKITQNCSDELRVSDDKQDECRIKSEK